MRKTEEFKVVFETEDNKKTKKGALKVIYEWLDTPIYAIILLALIFTFAFRLAGVKGSSMNPTLYNGDWIVINAVTTQVNRGDIVIITQPNAFNEPIIKRVIAKGGDTIDIDFDRHTVTVNGALLDEPYIAEPTARRGYYSYPMTIPEGKLFVMGDNRNESADSRMSEVGLIDERYVLGKAQIRLLPFGDWKIDDYEK